MTENTMNLNLKNLKVNLHITKACNYRCRYCFAQFKHQDLPLESWKRIIDNLKASGMVTKINFAGGEPLVYPHFAELVDYAYAQGFELSIITNGSLLLNEKCFPRRLFRKISMLGISVDSLNPEILRKLRCCDSHQRVLTEDKLRSLLAIARSLNPKITIKLNTVVTALNKDERLLQLGGELGVERWKVLKMKPFTNGKFSNYDLAITDDEFNLFQLRNPSGRSVPEASMDRSYIIIDNSGCLLDNEGSEDYCEVGSLLNEDFRSIFSRYHFDEELYQSRYSEKRAS